jgi:FkbM family methyltransferase
MKSESLEKYPLGRLVEKLRPCILDIGARGGADEELLGIAWASRIVCFEPEAAEAERLTRVGDPRWHEFTVLPFAVGEVSGPATLHVPESPAGASLLHHDPEMVERFGYDNLHIVRKKIPVETWTLDDLHAGGRIGRVDYMKIDVEGAELGILKAGSSLLKDSVALKVECSFLRQRLSQPLVWDVVQYLRESGFEIVDIQDIHRWRRRNLPAHPYRVRSDMEYSRGQVSQCDLIVLRSAEQLKDVEQALRLVVLSAALGFFDYAITLMRQNPQLAEQVRTEHGFDLEAELKRWSSTVGGHVVKRAVAAGTRALVPLVRSWAGRLPFPVLRQPY